LETLIEKVIQAREKYDLYLNLKKTNVMKNTGMDTFKMRGENIELVQYFNQFGSIIDEDGGN